MNSLDDCTAIRSNSCNSSARFSKTISLVLVLVLAAYCLPLLAQENVLVATTDGMLSLFDLASYAPLETVRTGYSFAYSLVPSPNPRLAFVPALGIVTDLSIGRRAGTIPIVYGTVGAMTTDGKSLLIASPGALSFVDPAKFNVVKTVDLKSILGDGQPGPLAVTAANAYVFPQSGFPSPKVAVVNLSTFAVSSISLPLGSFNSLPGANFAGVTPDGSTLVVLETEIVDSLLHVVLVNTASNQIVGDNKQPDLSSFPRALAITPDGQDPSEIFGYGVVYRSSVVEIEALDLRSNSPTYGNFLESTAVPLDPLFGAQSMVVNSDGSRLIVVGSSSQNQNSPNTLVVDTAKIFSDPTHAIIKSLTIEGGLPATAVCTGFFQTVPPNSAPTVTGTSGDITNDIARQVQITGTNFQTGALVRIGATGPLPAIVNGSSSLTVNVPANWAAGKAQDIIVTNPLTNGAPEQQNQSGLLAGQFNILPNPKFHPATQFATTNFDGSLSVYDIVQQTTKNVAVQESGSRATWPAFNVDGKYLYNSSTQTYTGYAVLPIDLGNDMAGAPIPIMGSNFIGISESLTGNLDPQTGKPVINAPWQDGSDLHLSVIDSDSTSPTFNNIIRTFDAGLNIQNGGLSLRLMTTSPDGRYTYLWYDEVVSGHDAFYLGIFNLATGAFTKMSSDSLGVTHNQSQVSISPDGKSLLLAVSIGAQTRIRVFDISNPIQPRRVGDISPVPVPGHGSPRVFNYQVVGATLYGIDASGIVAVFNFDRQKGDFRQRGYSIFQNAGSFYGAFAFSADGAYLYVTDLLNNQVSVLDAGKLSTGKDILLTNISDPYYPYGIAASPVPPPGKGTVAVHPGAYNSLVRWQGSVPLQAESGRNR